MYNSPRIVFASLALVLAIGLAQAQTKQTAAKPLQIAIPSAAIDGTFVTLEVRTARISDAMFAHLSREYKIEKNHLAVTNSSAATESWERLTTDADSFKSSCMTAAKSGEEVHFSSGSETPFVTGIKLVQSSDQESFEPQTSVLSSGFRFDMLPTLLPGNRHVMIRFNAELAEIPEGKVPLFPVTTFIAQMNEDGSKGDPIPFTQFLQQPTLTKRQVSQVVGLAVGETAIIYGGHMARTETQVDRVPFFADLPILGELFEKEIEKPVSNHLVYFVTPNVVNAPAPAEPCKLTGCRTLPNPAVAPTLLPQPVVMAVDGLQTVVFQSPVSQPTPSMPVAQLTSRCEVLAPAIPACKLPEKVQTPATPRAVTLRCKIIKFDASFFDRAEAEAWADLSPKDRSEPWRHMSDDAAERFCKAVKSQAGGEIIMQPTLMAIEGQSASVTASDESATIMGIGFVERAGVTVPTFHKPNECGTACEFLPTLSKDGRTCRLQMKVDHTQSSGSRPTPCEVTIKIPATDDTPEQTITESVQACFGVNQRCVHSTQDIAVGQCLLMYLNNSKSENGSQICALLVTPTVSECAAANVMPPQAPPALMKMPTCDKNGNCVYASPVSVLELRMTNYRKACQEERWAEARKLATECLELDPKCFLPK